MFSQKDSGNISWSCMKQAVARRKSASGYSEILCPSTRIFPDVGSIILVKSLINVDLPLPLVPTMAMSCPDLMERQMSFRADVSFSYEKHTSLHGSQTLIIQLVHSRSCTHRRSKDIPRCMQSGRPSFEGGHTRRSCDIPVGISIES